MGFAEFEIKLAHVVYRFDFVKIAQQNGGLLQGNQHLANQVKLQLPGDEVSDQTVAMTVIEAMPHYDQLL